jgi:hypothetical protein
MDWNFTSDFQGQQRSLNGGGTPQIIGEYPDPSPEALAGDPKGYLGRRPFIYHEPSNTAFVGPPGTHHDDVYRSNHALDPRAKGTYEGYVMKGLEKHINQASPDEASWFTEAPENHEEVLDTIAKAHGVKPRHFVPLRDRDDMWDFTSAVEPGSDEWVDNFVNELVGRIPKSPPVDPELEAKRKHMDEDPVGYERSHSWDPDGDVQYGNENIEWVPTHHLKKFMEYDRRPGGKDFSGNPERWNALSEHIKQNGFKNPIWIDYNKDTGHAHMSEGNHRTQIALDHGIPAMPVRVMRSRRTSPTQIPVPLHPQENWKDHNGEMWVPDMLKPSHIGLPVVPAPGSERLGAAEPYEPWEPGSMGKGILYYKGGTKLTTWKVNTVMNKHDEGMHHYDMMKLLDPDQHYCDIVAIKEDGAYTIWNPDQNPSYDKLIQQLDPRLHPDTATEWAFG